MKRMPRWLIWSLATVGLWGMWAVFVFFPLHAREVRVDALMADLNAKGSEQLRHIGMASVVVAQIDSCRLQLSEARQSMPDAADMNTFLAHLSMLGRGTGMTRVAAAPLLSSMMDLRSGAANDGATFGLDTLVVELSGAGRFRSVGEWLDQVETEPAFRGWESCRWDEGDTDGVVSFTGRVAFLVVIDNGRIS